MKTLITSATIIALVAAAPKASNLGYRDIYKNLVDAENSKLRIINGHEAEPHSIPYQVYLQLQASVDIIGGWICGGSLISPSYILTAGHCGSGAVLAIALLGGHQISGAFEESRVLITSREIIVHEDFYTDNDTAINDIAVIKLPAFMYLTDAIQIVKLPKRGDIDNNYAGEVARISGWGLTSGDGNEIADVLMYVDVKVITNEECEETFGDLLDSIICTSGQGNKGACNGDSGGPLAINDVQIGIVSYGQDNCEPGAPSAFTRITSFLDWIEEHTDVVID